MAWEVQYTTVHSTPYSVPNVHPTIICHPGARTLASTNVVPTTTWLQPELTASSEWIKRVVSKAGGPRVNKASRASAGDPMIAQC